MTLTEAQAIADIIVTADGGCSVCANALLKKCREAFPEFEWGALGSGGDLVVTGDMDFRNRYDRIAVTDRRANVTEQA